MKAYKMLVIYIVQMMCAVFPCSPAMKYSKENSSDSAESAFVPISKIRSAPDSLNELPTTFYTFPPPISIKKRQTVENPLVSTNEGELRGFTMKSVSGKSFSAFQGIPFAEPPTGDLRFRAPVKKSPWKGVRDAIVESPTCLQLDFIQQYKLTGTEDCLHLNVYTHKLPNRGQKLANPAPVMVFIHGGGFFFGSSNLYGPAYILEEDVVFVSMNYRLGALGFLSTSDEEAPGNNGLKDQTLALEWVKANIRFFGGDPNRVTIFGESAGASSVQFHMLSPLSRGLFHRGISESGCTFCFWSISEQAVEIGKKFASSVNCSTANSTEMMSCLRDLDGSRLVMGQLQFLKWTMYPVVVFGPVIEPKHKGAFLDDTPENIYQRGEAARVPWISGFNADEGALNIATVLLDNTATVQINNEWDKIGPIFLELNNATKDPPELARCIKEYYLEGHNVTFDTRKNAVKMFSDRYVIVCGVKSLQYHAKYSGAPVYAYHFNYRGSYSYVQLLGQKPSDWGVSHLDDLIYLVNNTSTYPTLKTTDEDYKVSRIMINLWTNFAKTGEPVQSLPDGKLNHLWKPLQAGTDDLEYLEINLNPQMISDPFNQRVKFWNNLQLDDN